MHVCLLDDLFAESNNLAKIKKQHMEMEETYDNNYGNLLTKYQIVPYREVLIYKSNLIGLPGESTNLYTIGIEPAYQTTGNKPSLLASSIRYLLCGRDNVYGENAMYRAVIADIPNGLPNTLNEDNPIPFSIEYDEYEEMVADVVLNIDTISSLYLSRRGIIVEM